MNKNILAFLGIFLVTALATGIGSYLGRSGVQEIQRLTFSRDEAEKLIHASGYKTFIVIKKHFPVEYEGILTELTQIVKSADSENEAAGRMKAHMVKIRQNYAKYIEFAPDEASIEVLRAYKSLLGQIYANESWQVCNQFSSVGGVGLDLTISNKYRVEFDTIGAATFNAIALGASAKKAEHIRASGEDYIEIYAGLLDAGFSEDQLLVLETGDTQDPMLCPIMVKLVELLINQSGQEGERVRSAFVADMTSS